MDLKKVCCLCAMFAVSPVFAKGSAAWQNDPVVGKYRFEEAAAATTVTFHANNRVLSVDGPYPREEYSQEALVESDELNRDLPLAKAVCALVDRKK